MGLADGNRANLSFILRYVEYAGVIASMPAVAKSCQGTNCILLVSSGFKYGYLLSWIDRDFHDVQGPRGLRDFEILGFRSLTVSWIRELKS